MDDIYSLFDSEAEVAESLPSAPVYWTVEIKIRHKGYDSVGYSFECELVDNQEFDELPKQEDQWIALMNQYVKRALKIK